MSNQSKAGIWVRREEGIDYTTLFEETDGEIVGFIPLEKQPVVKNIYLGAICFQDLIELYPLVARPPFNTNYGLFQNHFYPLGGEPWHQVPELLGKGLARKIEFEVVKDLLTRFSDNTPIVKDKHTTRSHLEYCKKIGITPFQPMPLREYHDILQRSIR